MALNEEDAKRLLLKYVELEKALAAAKAMPKLRTYKSVKFTSKDNEDITAFFICYKAEVALTTNKFVGWTDPQAIMYLIRAVEGRAFNMISAGIATSKRDAITYSNVVAYLKVTFVDSSRVEKVLDKLTSITQCTNINTYIRDFNTRRGQVTTAMIVPNATVLRYFIQGLKMNIRMGIAAVRPATLALVQEISHGMEVAAGGHSKDNGKSKAMDTSSG
jgi:Ty3 transposon capsid-like protein